MVLVAWPCLVGWCHMTSCALAAFLKAEMFSSRCVIDVAGKKWACRSTWASWHCRFYYERAWHASTFKITNLSVQKTQHENGPLGVFHTSTFDVILLNMGQDAQDGTKDYFLRCMMGRFSWKYHGPFFQTFCFSSTPAHFYIYGCRRPQLLHQIPKHRRLWRFIIKNCCEFPSNDFWSMANIYFS